MKTIRILTAAAALMGLTGASQAADSCSAQSSLQGNGEKSFTGSVVEVDTHIDRVAVKDFLWTKHFTLANDCAVSLQDKTVAGLGDLRPGERVSVRYNSDNGVLIAKYILQRDRRYSGRIMSIDPQARTLAVRDGWFTHDLLIGQNCLVTMRDNKPGELNNVHVGDTVTVVYEPLNGARIADRIEENSAMFAGTIQAIDANNRFITVNDTRGAHRFNLGDHCPIVIHGKMDGTLGNLRIGETVSVNYDTRDGVLVANRLSPSTAAPQPAHSAQTARMNSWPYAY